MGSIVCVTGGTGFIGRRLVSRLVEQGHVVRVLSRGGKPVPAGVHRVQGDLLAQVPEAFLHDAAIVYHCAGELADKSVMHELHVEGTRRLLARVSDEVAASGRPLRWVQLSSVGAYGPLAQCRGRACCVTEDWPDDPVGEYEVSKAMADRLVLDWSRNEQRIGATVLRPSTVFGPGMPNQSLRALLDAIGRGRFFHIGRHPAVATYVHVDDVARALLLCGTDPRVLANTYILSNDCTFAEIVAAVATAAHRRPPALRVPERLARALARAAAVFVRHPLTPERIDALTRRVRYSSDRLAGLGFSPARPVPQAMVDYWRGASANLS
ncbi:NAD(P)-dependent oxidoreductase [Ramlibacter tataouinensis]|uniref:NAD-dependent epimerase/dehydratase family protein n=1 Tax=Ramlibacter tataouinensis TaxID=94132 RepID=UPI0022F3A252|nr:NAD(P)-dependent oxidoreductase [Ramlibacter tataouinensis]WBY00733.1 NAD(P)-dependent oxidoreductase [Ramlibacter tataouinensis]